MGIRSLIDRVFAPPQVSTVIDKYLQTGRSRCIDDLFDGWVELDEDTFQRLIEIHSKHAQEGDDGLYGGLFRLEAKSDLSHLANELRQAGK